MRVTRRWSKLPMFGRVLFVTALLLTLSMAAFGGRQLGPSVAQAAVKCTIDTAGANDVLGPKDLNKMCVDNSGAPTSLSVTWNWDEISVSGANTLDACSLYDTDGDGNVNYSVCATTTNGSTSTTTLYACGDGTIDRCTSPMAQIANPQSSCTVGIQNTDPFPAGAFFPQDMVASCTVYLADLGAGSANLVDVCSYPLQQPNSDPSDCVLNQNNAGKLEVQKVVVPPDAFTFNLQVDGVTKATGGNGTTTGTVVVSASTHTVGETAGTANLSDYSTQITCRELHGTGAVVASVVDTSLTVAVSTDEDIVCVITNMHVATPTATATNTPTDTPTATNTPTDTPTDTPTATNTPTPTPSIGGLTPGYWKNHLANSNSKGPFFSADCKNVYKYGGSCSTNGPWAIQYLPKLLGNYSVDTITTAAQVVKGMNCSSTKDQDAIGCLAGHLLATKLNLANGSLACPGILQAVADADAFLKGLTVNGVPGIVYVGPSGTYGKLTAAQRNLVISLKTKLDNYNNNIGCP